jgi:radical SAM protein with 4Fe4S-binding SPASM domain
MDFDLFCRIINDASLIGVKRIHLYLHGEPMLHPQIVEMIRYIKTKNIGVNLTTNGILFNQERMESILRSGVNSADYIVFSILGCSKKVHEKIMKGVNHDKVLKNIYDFLELRKKHGTNGPVIETIFYTMAENKHETEAFVEFWRGIVDHARIVGKISEYFSGYKKRESAIPPRKQTCKNLWERMTVFWNGDVTLCCADIDGDCLLGSLKTQSIKDVWNSRKLLSIKKIHKEKQFQKMPLCLRCDM